MSYIFTTLNLPIQKLQDIAIALLSGQNWFIFIIFQSPIKMNHDQLGSFWASTKTIAFGQNLLISISFQLKSVNFNMSHFGKNICKICFAILFEGSRKLVNDYQIRFYSNILQIETLKERLFKLNLFKEPMLLV